MESYVAKDNLYRLEEGLAERVGRMIGKTRGTPEYANAGSVRNSYEKAQRKLNSRNFRRGLRDTTLKAKDFAFLKEFVAKARKIEE